MGRGILLWLLGVPIPIIILLALFWHYSTETKKQRGPRKGHAASSRDLPLTAYVPLPPCFPLSLAKPDYCAEDGGQSRTTATPRAVPHRRREPNPRSAHGFSLLTRSSNCLHRRSRRRAACSSACV